MGNWKREVGRGGDYVGLQVSAAPLSLFPISCRWKLPAPFMTFCPQQVALINLLNNLSNSIYTIDVTMRELEVGPVVVTGWPAQTPRGALWLVQMHLHSLISVTCGPADRESPSVGGRLCRGGGGWRGGLRPLCRQDRLEMPSTLAPTGEAGMNGGLPVPVVQASR